MEEEIYDKLDWGMKDMPTPKHPPCDYNFSFVSIGPSRCYERNGARRVSCLLLCAPYGILVDHTEWYVIHALPELAHLWGCWVSHQISIRPSQASDWQVKSPTCYVVGVFVTPNHAHFPFSKNHIREHSCLHQPALKLGGSEKPSLFWFRTRELYSPSCFNEIFVKDLPQEVLMAWDLIVTWARELHGCAYALSSPNSLPALKVTGVVQLPNLWLEGSVKPLDWNNC